METATAVTADEGVSASTEEPVSTPETGEESPTSEKGEVEVQLSPKAQQRMQKLANEAREAKKLREEYKQLQEQYKKAEGAIAIDKWLRENPARASGFVEWMKQADKIQQKDPYEGFAPEVAERFRKYDAIAQKIEEAERLQQQTEIEKLKENETRLETHFESLLKSKGFLDESGGDDNLLYTLSRGTLAVLAESIDDPRLANEKQLEQALDKFLQGINSLEKRALKKAVKPTPPASASNKGTTPIGKTKETDEDRVLRIARELE